MGRPCVAILYAESGIASSGEFHSGSPLRCVYGGDRLI